MITKIAFMSHPTKDMAASRKFFGDVLGLKQTASYEDKWCEFDTPEGKSIALDSFSPPGNGPYLALETDNIEKEIARLRKRGVPVVMEIMDNQVCKMAMVQDPSGNALMLHQMERSRLKAKNAAATAAGGSAKAKAPSAKSKASSSAKTKASTAKSKAGSTARPMAKKATAKSKPTARSRRRG